jgi:acyl-CoA hydrolase
LVRHRGLTVWSEMFSDGVLALERAGCLDREIPITASFSFGSRELYAWVDRNKRIQMLRSEKTNAPGIIAEHPNVISVNAALQVDLFAQANASRVRGQVYSGFGGQTDFIVGALHSPGGQAIIALRSWHPKADVSTVVPLLTGPVTSFQHSHIVTEHGAAAIWGHDQTAQAQHIIDHAAHPSARDELREAGQAMGLALVGGRR